MVQKIDIDLVFTCVNRNDKKWLTIREQMMTPVIYNKAAFSNVRYKHPQYLKYAIRSVLRNAPFIRKIYLVTDGQSSSFLEEFSRDIIEIVHHSEIIPLKYLPTYNSACIEFYLHKIPNISRFFIYMNDDNFLANPIRQDEIIQDNKVNCYLGENFLDDNNINNKWLDREFIKEVRPHYLHQLYIFDREIMKIIHQYYYNLVSHTMLYRFSSHYGYSPKTLHTYIGNYYDLVNLINTPSKKTLLLPGEEWLGNGKDRGKHEIVLSYKDIKDIELKLTLLEGTEKFICLNNTKCKNASLEKRFEQILLKFLERKFPPKQENIDLVYLWVDGSDPKIKHEREATKARLKKQNMYQYLNKEIDNPSRYRDNQELKYSLRSAIKNLPWINHIYIVTDNQVPEWLNTSHPKISIINHQDIVPEKYLPVFNAYVLEAFIHMIPGLSEKFIYSNDDFFVNQPLSVDFFFRGDLPIYRLQNKPTSENCSELANSYKVNNILGDYQLNIPDKSKKKINKWLKKCRKLRPYSWKGEPNTNEIGWISGWKNTNAILDGLFGESPRKLLAHSTMSMCKGDCLRISSLFSEIIKINNSFPFRSIYNFNTVNGLYPYYLFEESKAIFDPTPLQTYTIYMTDDPYLNFIQFSYITEIGVKLLCIQDSFSDEKIGKSYQEYLEILFPNKSPFEKGLKEL